MRKWREMEKAVGEGGVVLGQEPMLAPIVKLTIFNGKCKKYSHLKVFFSLFVPSILTNKLILFF